MTCGATYRSNQYGRLKYGDNTRWKCPATGRSLIQHHWRAAGLSSRV